MTIHSKTSLLRNCGNAKYKTQNPCNENPCLKSTDLRQTQRFIESWSISPALFFCSLRFFQVHWCYNSNIISKLYCSYRNHVPILRKKTHTQKTTTKQRKTAATYNSPCSHRRWRCYQAIALKDQQIGPTSPALLSPQLNDATR